MVEIITTQKIKTDNKFNNACDLIIQDCMEIQKESVDNTLTDLATNIIEALEKLEQYYV